MPTARWPASSNLIHSKQRAPAIWQGWKENIEISFDFEEGSYYYGVCNNPENYQLSQENKALLHQRLREKGIPVSETEWYPFYEDIENLTIVSWESDIIESDAFFESCKLKIETLLEALEKLVL